MFKQSSEILKTLESVRADFESARQQLIRCESPAAVEQALLRAGRLLESLKSRNWSSITDIAALQLLQDLRVRAARVQLLLDTAAAFRCGVALAGPAVSETYSADGSWQTTFPNDQICLNA